MEIRSIIFKDMLKIWCIVYKIINILCLIEKNIIDWWLVQIKVVEDFFKSIENILCVHFKTVSTYSFFRCNFYNTFVSLYFICFMTILKILDIFWKFRRYSNKIFWWTFNSMKNIDEKLLSWSIYLQIIIKSIL